MEIEVDDTVTILEKIPKKPAAKKDANDLSGNLQGAETGGLDRNEIGQFVSDLQTAVTLEEELRLMDLLNRTTPDLIEKFAESEGIALISELFIKAGTQASEKAELIEKILSFWNKIKLSTDILDRTQIHIHLEEFQNRLEMPEDLCVNACRLLAKWKKTIENWRNGQQKNHENLNKCSNHAIEEKQSRGHRRDHDRETNRNFIKRTHDRNNDKHRAPRDHGRDSRISDKRRSRIFDRDEHRRDTSSSHHLSRSRSRQERDNYDRKHSANHRDRANSSRSSSEEGTQKKNVK